MVSPSEQAFLDQTADRITKLRKERGFSQLRLAKESGLTEGHIGHIEQGRRRPTLVTVYRIARGLGVHPDKLIPSK
jgi:transcriptional regulator with XRE-family HTH domain